MNLWTIPLPAIVALALVVLSFGLAGRKIQSVAYDLADQLVLIDGSGVSKRNLESFSSRIVPSWAKLLGWVASFAALGLLVYLGMRFGWPWAVGYAVADHGLKTMGIPSLPTVKQIHKILQARAEKTVPKIAPHMAEVTAH
jgi:hypothetical protein